MGRLRKIKDEITNDPNSQTYPAGVDETERLSIVSKMNAQVITRNRASLSGDEVFRATAAGDYTPLANEAKDQWLMFCQKDQIDPFDGNNIAFLRSIFGAPPSDTETALEAIRTEIVSPATDAGIGGRVRLGQVEDALALP